MNLATLLQTMESFVKTELPVNWTWQPESTWISWTKKKRIRHQLNGAQRQSRSRRWRTPPPPTLTLRKHPGDFAVNLFASRTATVLEGTRQSLTQEVTSVVTLGRDRSLRLLLLFPRPSPRIPWGIAGDQLSAARSGEEALNNPTGSWEAGERPV